MRTRLFICRCREVEELREGDEHANDPNGHGDEDGRRAAHARRQWPDDGVVPAGGGGGSER